MPTSWRRSLSKELTAGIKYLHFGLGAVIFICLSLFIYTLSQSAFRGYEFRQQEINYNESENLNHKLKVQSLEAKSFNIINDSKKVKGMVKPEETEFLENRLKRLTKATNDPV